MQQLILEPFDVRRDRLDYYRWLQTQQSTEFGATFTDHNGETRSYASWAPTALPSQEQLELGFKGHALHEAIRLAWSDRVEQLVIPLYGARWIEDYIARMRGARHSGALGYNLKTGKYVRFWDTKAGLSRYCPDDAREEAMRIQRKYLPYLEAQQQAGYNIYYCVLTTRNAPAGGLLPEMKRQFKRFRQLLKAKFPDGSLKFPEIKGALVVQEAPLGRSRDWNVHLNVVLVVDGYLDYGKLRSWWHWDLYADKLPVGHNAIRGALTELIKYAVAATVTKSAAKAAHHGETTATRFPSGGDNHRGGSVGSMAEDVSPAGDQSVGGVHDSSRAAPPGVQDRAPPMLEWTGTELLEWMRAMRGFRRTRSYGCLFGLTKPDREEDGPIIWLGTFSSRGYGRGYDLQVPLLRSIPEDKSIGQSPAERWLALIKALKPAGVAGAGTLGDQIPRDALHRSLAQLHKM